MKRISINDLTSEQLDDLYDRLDQRWGRITKQSNRLQELKRENFQLRMDIVALLDDMLPSRIVPGEISAARKDAA